MERREFLRKSVVTAAVVVASPSLLVLEGCPSVNVKALLNTVISAGEAILKVAEPSAPWLQPLENAILALQQAEGGWETGSPVQIVITALNTVQAVLAVIPVTAPYAALIAVLVAGVEAVLTALAPTPAPAQTAVNNPYRGRVALKGRNLRHPTFQGAFKAQWNETADAINWPQCKI